jgi:hypothetical protein
MKAYSDHIDALIRYFINERDGSLNKEHRKFFKDFFSGDIDLSELYEKFNGTYDCGSRSAIKEMMDSLSGLNKIRNIRNKSRSEFFVCNAVRSNGKLTRFNRKKIFLGDQVII